MTHTNNIPRIQRLLSLPHECNRNCEEPVKGQARLRAKEENRNVTAFVPPELTCLPNPTLPLLTCLPIRAAINSRSAGKWSRLLTLTRRLSFYR